MGSSKIRDSSKEEKAEDLQKPEKEVKQKISKSKNFRCIIQTDYKEQMEVFDFLSHSLQYSCVWILHDKDAFTAEDMDDNGIHVRKNGDGSQSQYKVGDIKPPHYHLYLETGVSLSECGMSKRFFNAVHFQIVSDPMECLLYFTHETFSGRGKYKYPRSDINGDLALYDKRVRELRKCSSSAIVTRIHSTFYMFEGNKKEAVYYLASIGDDDAINSILAHSNFYDKFI